MSFEHETLQERARIISRENRKVRTIINGITQNKTISNIITTISYKIPLHWEETDFGEMDITSLAINGEQAQTTVCGVPVDSDYKIILNEFSETYGLEEMSRRHGRITNKLETLHLKSSGVIYASRFPPF